MLTCNHIYIQCYNFWEKQLEVLSKMLEDDVDEAESVSYRKC
jgi:hypothetical protein